MQIQISSYITIFAERKGVSERHIVSYATEGFEKYRTLYYYYLNVEWSADNSLE